MPAREPAPPPLRGRSATRERCREGGPAHDAQRDTPHPTLPLKGGGDKRRGVHFLRHHPPLSLRFKKASRSKRWTSCSLFKSAPWSGGTSFAGSRVRNASGGMSSTIKS